MMTAPPPPDIIDLAAPPAPVAVLPPSRGERVVVWLAPILLLILLVVVWESWVRIRNTPSWYLPAPTDVARALWDERSSLLDNAWVTLKEVIVGLAVAIATGVGMAVAIHASRLVERTVYPLVIASQAIPVVALAPLLLIWFGHGLAPKVIMTALIAFFPITVATADGLRSADRETLDMLRAMGASRTQRFRIVQAPNALPSFFSGLKVAVAVAVIGAVIGELVGSDSGLGHTIILANASLRTDLVFACVVLLSVMAIALFGLVTLLERLLMPWRRYQIEAR
jgi:ABC-type nitrate/sulfonate/bicarbonate transport system permease component